MKDGKLKKILLKIPGSILFYKMLRFLKNTPVFINDFIKFKRHNINKRFKLSLLNLKPILQEKTATTNFEPHYIYHPAWAIRIIKKINPSFHIDISSTLSFSTMLSAFIPVKFYDYRPAFLNLDNLESLRGDLNNLEFKNNSVQSISCMHVVEHIGLGRYGDKIDYDGDLKAMSELKRVLAVGGSLLFVVPVGKEKIEFNAHRIYSYEQIINNFSDLELKEFSLVPDNFRETGIIIDADSNLVKKQNWGCGCFWFIKK